MSRHMCRPIRSSYIAPLPPCESDRSGDLETECLVPANVIRAYGDRVLQNPRLVSKIVFDDDTLGDLEKVVVLTVGTDTNVGPNVILRAESNVRFFFL